MKVEDGELTEEQKARARKLIENFNSTPASETVSPELMKKMMSAVADPDAPAEEPGPSREPPRRG